MEAQAYICPWCINDHGSPEENTRCRDAYECGKLVGYAAAERDISKMLERLDGPKAGPGLSKLVARIAAKEHVRNDGGAGSDGPQ